MQIFDVLKKFFGWCDESSRKRHAVDLDDYDYINPKKIRRDCGMSSHREVVELEEDDVEVCEDLFESFNSSHNSHNPHNCHNSHNCQDFRKRKPQSKIAARKNHLTMGSFGGKSRLNFRPSVSRYTALSKTHQLREKEQYGQMLQNFLPRIQVIPSTPDIRKKPIELIDIETCEPTTSTELFSTPHFKCPWHPQTTKTLQGRSVELINLDEDETSTKSQDSKSSPKTMKKLSMKNESIATNSLRDRLSGMAVMQSNFIPSVAERYNERVEYRLKEVEELEKTKMTLAEYNRLQREAIWEEQLARSMRLFAEILKEPDEEEGLPELTPEMMDVIDRALEVHPDQEVLADGFGLRIKRKDMHTLYGLNWLNDEVINFYMNLLIERGKGEKYPNVYAMNTFFYPKLMSGGHSALKRWTRKVDIFAQDLVVVPIHLGVHWCMSIIDFRDKSIRYFDSMGGKNGKCLQALRNYLEDESLDKKHQKYDTSDWSLECMRDIPQQMNGSDCGVFSCTFAEFITADRKITFSQDDMPYFRHKMVYEILKCKLL